MNDEELKEAFDKILSEDFVRVCFQLKDGKRLEGYFIEINGESMVFGEGGPLSSDELRKIPLADISLEEFAAYHEKQKKWLNLSWDDGQKIWSTKAAT